MIRFRFPCTLTIYLSQIAGRTGDIVSSWGGFLFGKINPVQPLLLLIVPLVALTSDGWAKHSDAVREIPFKLYGNHVVVAVGRLGRLEQRNLVIDTGTTPTMVDDATAHELGLEQVGHSNGSINVVNGKVPTSYSILPTLDLGPIHRESMPVAVANLSWLREQAGIRVDAVIGLEVLAQINFQIDYQSKKLSFGAIRIPRSAVPMADTDRLLMVQAKLNGLPARLMVDTGGSAVVLFAGTLPQSTNWRTLGSSAKFSNLAGQTVLRKVQLKELKIGDTDLSGTIALLGETPACCAFQGILGISARQFKRIVFDFRRHLVGFELQDSAVLESFEPQSCGASWNSAVCRNANINSRLIEVR